MSQLPSGFHCKPATAGINPVTLSVLAVLLLSAVLDVSCQTNMHSQNDFRPQAGRCCSAGKRVAAADRASLPAAALPHPELLPGGSAGQHRLCSCGGPSPVAAQPKPHILCGQRLSAADAKPQTPGGLEPRPGCVSYRGCGACGATRGCAGADAAAAGCGV